MSVNELHQFITESTGNENNICEITAMKNGEVVYEDYWHEYRPGDAVNVMSVTKSIMALLVGIAVAQGYIQNINQRVLDYFPHYTVKRGEKTIFDVTIRHLLTMTAPYKYKSEPWTKVCTSDDWTKAALDLLGGRAGITGEFKYSTLGIQIISGIIENAAGVKCIDFANEHLFTPLGISEHRIHGASSKEDQFSFLMDKTPRKNEWYSDPKGTVTAGWGLALSASDMAVIGEMCRCEGNYQGKRILPAEWINEMTTPYLELGRDFGYLSYGYLWYRPDKERSTFAAIGDGGNVIYVDKEKGISVGIAGTFKPRIFDRIQFIENHIVPLL